MPIKWVNLIKFISFNIFFPLAEFESSQDSNNANPNKPHSVEDTTTTNIFISNLSPKVSSEKKKFLLWEKSFLKALIK